MATTDALTQVVRDALVAGRSRDEVRNALTEAGWSNPEIADSLAAFAMTVQAVQPTSGLTKAVRSGERTDYYPKINKPQSSR